MGSNPQALVLELHITEQANGWYGVTSRSHRHSDAHISIQLDLGADWLDDNLQLPESGHSSWELLEHFGTQLFEGVPQQGYDGLFSGDVLSHYRTCLGAAIERGEPLLLELRVDPPELENLPWELLFDPQRHMFLATARECHLVRTASGQGPLPSLAVSGTLRGLIVAADAPDLGLQQEINVLQDLAQRYPTRLQWEVLTAPTADGFRRCLDAQPVHIVHFCGHGFGAPDAEPALVLGPGANLSIRNLKLVLEGRRELRLVVLNGCGTGQRNPTRVFSGAGERLLGAGVPAVIATRWPLQNAVAPRFA